MYSFLRLSGTQVFHNAASNKPIVPAMGVVDHWWNDNLEGISQVLGRKESAYRSHLYLVHSLYEPGYVTPCVGNLAEEKSLRKYIWFPNRCMNTGNLLKTESSSSLMIT
jgi:hypothetical protein